MHFRRVSALVVAWGSVVFKALRYKSEWFRNRRVFFPWHLTPGVDSVSDNEYQVNPGGKGGRCLSLTTYHLHVPMSRNLGALTSWNPVGLLRPIMGQLFSVLVSICRYPIQIFATLLAFT
jgi:hypothetical protein